MHKKTSLGTYLAHAGICSRRKADALVRQGLVRLNGKVVTEPGTDIKKNDIILYQDRRVLPEKKVYIVLNKPTDCLSTVVDEGYDRDTVVDLVKDTYSQRMYPIGRLDYRTTGLILLTNDGDFSQRLAHPRYEITKIYKATLNVAFKQCDLDRLKRGVILDDGPMQVDDIYFDKFSKDKKDVIIVIHSGKKRIIRRLFQYVGYRVMLLDRINYAGLTKRGLKVGKWRLLSGNEIVQLKKLGRTK
jgi:23S rRNA pseudouridine2605 synthase